VKDSIVLEIGVFGLGINQKTQTLYGTATRAGSVIAIDIKTGKTLATITNGQEKGHTREVVVDEENNKVYVSDVGGGIWEIDGKTNKHIQQIDGAGPSVTGLALDGKNNKLFAINFKTSNIVAIDLKTKNVLDSFPSGGDKAINLDFDAKRNRLYIAHTGSGTVSVLDANTGEVLKSVETGKGALGIRYSPVNDIIYVANRGAQTVTIINAEDYSVKANIKAGSLPNTIALDQNGVAFTSHKANGAGRPKQGEKPKPSNDPNGDIISRINL
jgi:YVTN family beta-propeller protein